MKSEIAQAVDNLIVVSNAFEKAANDPKNYNTDFGYYLEQMSYGMYKTAQDIKEHEYIYGGF